MASRVIEFGNRSFHAHKLGVQVTSPVLMPFVSEAPVEENSTTVSSRDGLRFVRGCFAGLAIEAVAGVVLYGLWELLHFFR